MRAEGLAKLARSLARLIGASIRTSNEALRAQWHARLLLLEHYERAQASGEVAKRGNPDFVNVPEGNNSAATTDELGLSRKRLSEARKVARAGGLGFADAVIRQASEVGVEGTSAMLVRSASGLMRPYPRTAWRQVATRCQCRLLPCLPRRRRAPRMPHPTTQELRAMIKQAMRDRAPRMYRRLKAAGLLEQEIDDRVAVWNEAREIAIGAPNSPYQKAAALDAGLDEKVAALTMAAAAAQEQAFAVALEFPSEEPDEMAPA